MGFYKVSSAQTSNVPDYYSAGYCMLMAIPRDTLDTCGYQIIFTPQGDMRTRAYINETWTTWREITHHSLQS